MEIGALSPAPTPAPATPAGPGPVAQPNQPGPNPNQLNPNPNLSKTFASIPKAVKGPAMAAAMLRNTQAEVRQIETAAAAGKLTAEQAKEAKAGWEKVSDFVKDADKRGVLSIVSTGASLFCLGVDWAENGLPQGVNDVRTWSALKDFTSALGSVDSMAKLFVKKGVSDATYLGKAIKAARWLGPIADAGGAAIDGYKAYKSYTEADVGRTIGNGVSALGGVATAGAGVAILAGTAALLGGALINHYFGDSNEEKFLKQMGRDYANDDNYRYIYPTMGAANGRHREMWGNGEIPPLIH